MQEFFISPKVAKLLFMWTASCIVGLSVACVIFDKEDEEDLQMVKLHRQSVMDITSEIKEANNHLKGHGLKIDEINNSIMGILGIVKGALEVSPSLKPEINIHPGKPKSSRKPQIDTLKVVTTVNTNDSIVITIDNGDSIASIPSNEAMLKTPSKKRCCCCNCCCNGCREEGCR